MKTYLRILLLPFIQSPEKLIILFYCSHMKRMLLTLLCVVFVHILVHAQEPLTALREKKLSKPSLFTSVPEQLEVASTELYRILSSDVNEKISAQLSSQFQMVGVVVDKNQHTPGSLTMNVRLQNHDNALFNVTIHFQADNSTSIRGRIIHPGYGDVLELYKEREKYYLRKISQRLYMTD
jgi:hypothetical protein